MSGHATTPEDEWRSYLLGEHPDILRARRLLGRLPSDPRCRMCRSPFANPGALLARRFGIRPWEKNPNVCRRCITSMAEHGAHGAEIELSLLFVDIRGSTTIAEGMAPDAFSALINRFYEAVVEVLIAHDAVIDKFVGDEVIGLFIPGIAGERHPARAIEAARGILEATGHGTPDGPWAPVGIGVHTGVAHVGLVGTVRGVLDFTALGDSVNTTARLAASARAGEALVSAAAVDGSGGVLGDDLERRALDLRGRREPVEVRVMRVVPVGSDLLGAAAAAPVGGD